MRVTGYSMLTATSMTLAVLALPADAKAPQDNRRLATFANPVDLPYRYQEQAGKPAYREGADPTVIWFKDRYWLFVSHSHGYWHSKDLLHWTFVRPTGYDVGLFAPTVEKIGDKLYLSVSELGKKIWVTDDPLAGKWTDAADVKPGFFDPALFLDDDGRLYMYEGLSPKDPLKVHELDPHTFQILRTEQVPASRDEANRGWEVRGDNNDRPKEMTYIEGSWMTKYKGRYYLQYSAPGTQYRSYADGVLVADKPMGPFRYQDQNPFSFKPTGFIAGAGHGSTFRAQDGKWWHTATMTISKRHIFERRIGLFPTTFTSKGELAADTYLSDYPRYIDGERELTGWMLLSYKKPVTVSSSLPGFAPSDALDENVRTSWSAASGNVDEWFQVDLGAVKRVEAVQINFADQDSIGKGISTDSYRYILEGSTDGKDWSALADHSTEGRDSPHDYIVLPAPARTRFIRLRNAHSPDGGRFSLYDLRIFGSAEGKAPAAVAPPQLDRDTADGRKATINWSASKGADFYVVRVGTRPDLLIQNFQVYDGATSTSIGSLTKGASYCAAVDAVNETGITRGKARC